MRLAIVAIAVVSSVVALVADDRSITFDKAFDFSTLKTFAVSETKVSSSRPELSNPLVARQVGPSGGLVAKGVTENVDGWTTAPRWGS